MTWLTYGIAALVFTVVGLTAFAVEVWAFIDCAIRRPGAFFAAGKLKKTTWMLLTGVAAFVGFSGVPVVRGGGGFGGILSIAAIVVAIVYLVDVRPAVREPRTPRQPKRGSW